MTRPEPRKIIDLITATLRARRPDPRPDIPTLRAHMDRIARSVQPPRDISITTTSLAARPAEHIAPPHIGDHTLLYLHGGGFVAGSLRSHRELAARIARAARAQLYLLDYRLAPEHPWPAAIDDTHAAYLQLLEQRNPAHVTLIGDSAGGNLVLSTLLRLRDRGEPLPASAVLLSPWLDLTGRGESIHTRADRDPLIQPEALQHMARLYLGGASPHTASPLFADLGGLPPLFLQAGDAEILLDDTRRLTQRARKAGVTVHEEIWDDMIHVFQILAFLLPEAQRAIDAIGRFIPNI